MIVQILDIIIIGLLIYFAYKRYRDNKVDGLFYILLLFAFLILILMLVKIFYF